MPRRAETLPRIAILLLVVSVIRHFSVRTRDEVVRERPRPEPTGQDLAPLSVDGGDRTSAERAPEKRRRRRRLGSFLIVLGAVLVAYAAAVVFWRDPVTDLYARWQQHELDGSVAQVFREYEARAAADPLDVKGRRNLEAELAASAGEFERRMKLGQPLGRLAIPKLDLNTVFIHGTRWAEDLSRGPGHYPETTIPGRRRTVAIAGHRTTFGAPFRHIDDLRRGDVINIRLPYGTFRYRVFAHEIVKNNDWSIIRNRGFDTLVLSACHPLYSAKQRWVVYARLVRVKPVGGEPFSLRA